MKRIFLSSGILLLLVGCTTVESNNRLEQEVLRKEAEVRNLDGKVSTLKPKVQKAESDYRWRDDYAKKKGLIDMLIEVFF